MGEGFIKTIRKGYLFVRNNPQVLYTLFLLVVLPLAFIVSGEQFLSAARSNVERAEETRITALHDALIDIASDTLTDPAALQFNIERVSSRDADIASLSVVVKEGDGVRTIASSRQDEVGKMTLIGATPGASGFEYRFATLQPDETYVSTTRDVVTGDRILRGVRAIKSADGSVAGFLLSDVSMRRIDAATQGNIQKAYLVLLFIIILMVLLLLRQARIVDYAALYKKLAEVDKMKNDFMSMATHELRTPLTVIRGYASMLVESKKLGEDERNTVELISRSSEQLNGLVNDLLDVMRIEEGRLEFSKKEVDISASAKEVAEMLAFPAKEKGLILSFSTVGETCAMLDPDRLRQVLLNIVGNAVKYTPTGSVTVSVVREGERGTVRVSDTGIGISAEEQKKLFTKFYRVRSKETDDIRGTGLGLWITLALIQKMGGTIGIESIKGKGTDVTVSFPLK